VKEDGDVDMSAKMEMYVMKEGDDELDAKGFLLEKETLEFVYSVVEKKLGFSNDKIHVLYYEDEKKYPITDDFQVARLPNKTYIVVRLKK